MGQSSGANTELQGLANRHTDGDNQKLADSINNFLVSVSSDLSRLSADHDVFKLKNPLPAKFSISVNDTERALNQIKVNRATGPDNIPPWILKDLSCILARPLTAIFNCSL